VKNRPIYAIDSVDRALRLAQLLQQEGPLGISAAAERIGVAQSTAHRLMAMLVYRDFAVQTADRRYSAGPLLRRSENTPAIAEVLRRCSRPYMQELAAEINESINLEIRVGTDVRFVDSIECQQVVRVGDRAGRTLPAHKTSGGKALLASLPGDDVRALYGDRGPGVDTARLLNELQLVRKCGFAINNQQTEPGVAAVGVPIWPASGLPVGALCLGVPAARFKRERIPVYVSSLRAASAKIRADLASAPALEGRRHG
jgi:IclR family transcriptional regulator, acetate operon repressor